jgi:hypothetical protein
MGASSSTQNTNALTANDLVQYNVNRRKLFKTTIAIAAIYGFVALLLLIIILADTNDVTKLGSDFLPFTITFIGGMVVIMLLLIIQIATFSAVASNPPDVSDKICPDYYVLQKTDTSSDDYQKAPLSAQPYMTYKCVPDSSNVYNLNQPANPNETSPMPGHSNVLGQTFFQLSTSGVNPVYVPGVTLTPSGVPNDPKQPLMDLAPQMYPNMPQTGIAPGSSNIRCDVVYPQFLANQDNTMFPNNPSAMRCAYSKVCNIPWSGVCLNPSL